MIRRIFAVFLFVVAVGCQKQSPTAQQTAKPTRPIVVTPSPTPMATPQATLSALRCDSGAFETDPAGVCLDNGVRIEQGTSLAPVAEDFRCYGPDNATCAYPNGDQSVTVLLNRLQMPQIVVIVCAGDQTVKCNQGHIYIGMTMEQVRKQVASPGYNGPKDFTYSDSAGGETPALKLEDGVNFVYYISDGCTHNKLYAIVVGVIDYLDQVRGMAGAGCGQL